jgi:hypothetical protein
MSSNNINQQLSLYIPFVFTNITEERIKHIFNTFDIGMVDRVDFVEKVREQDGKPYKMAFVHFSEWYINDYVEGIHKKLMSSGNTSTRIVYEDPWHWNIFMNTKPRTVNEVALERELIVAKKIMASERCRGDYFQMIASTWNMMYPNDCVHVHSMCPILSYQPIDIDPIEGYGIPWIIAPNPQHCAHPEVASHKIPSSQQGYVNGHVVDPAWQQIPQLNESMETDER